MSSKCDFRPLNPSQLITRTFLNDKIFTLTTHKRDIPLTYAYLMVEYDEI